MLRLVLGPALASARGLLGGIPPWAWALVAALAWGAWQRHQAHSQAAELARQQVHAAAQRERAAIEAQAETTRRLQAHQEVANHARRQTDQAHAHAAAAAAAAGRLRAQLAKVRAAPGASYPAPAAGCPTAEPGAGVLAELLERADSRAGALAAAADASRIAGQACERAYDALTAGQ